MARTDKFREQHAELLRIGKDLAATLDETKLAADASAARSQMSSFLGKLLLHLATEDQSLYPELAKSTDPAVATVVQRFQREMGGLSKTVQAWADRWPSPSSIKPNPREFIKETRGILTALSERIHREHKELYPLLDKAAAAAKV
jgi:DUF438 domain-containing protein